MKVGEYWMGEPERAAQAHNRLLAGYLRPVGVEPQTHDGRAGRAHRRAGSARQAVSRPGMALQPVLRLHQAVLPDHQPLGRGDGRGGRRARPAHAPEGRLLRQAGRKRPLAVQLRLHQPGNPAPDAGQRRRQSGARPAHARRGHQGRPWRAQDPPVGCLQVQARRDPGGDPRQGHPPERHLPAHPVPGDHQNGAQAPAHHRPAVDQQILHPRPRAREILHSLVRGTGPHRLRRLLGQSRPAPGKEELRALHARGHLRNPST